MFKEIVAKQHTVTLVVVKHVQSNSIQKNPFGTYHPPRSIKSLFEYIIKNDNTTSTTKNGTYNYDKILTCYIMTEPNTDCYIVSKCYK